MKPRAKKRYGQHFLEAVWADRVVQAIEAQPHDRFVEIGPGPGILTVRLARKVAHLTAVEIDPDMVAALTPNVPANVTIAFEDFLDFDLDLAGRAGPLRIAGNLPYNAATPILLKLIDARRRGVELVNAAVMIQREVADRIEAGPGTKDYGPLSIVMQLRATVSRLLTLPPGAFRPQPKVHSAVVRLDFHDPRIVMKDEATFHGLVRSIFTQRRKTLSNALRAFAESRGIAAREALSLAALDGSRRPETLQLTELARLADAIPSRN